MKKLFFITYGKLIYTTLDVNQVFFLKNLIFTF